MTRHEIEKKLTEMSEEVFKFYHENVPEGGRLSMFEANRHIIINNEAAFNDKYSGAIDVLIDKIVDGENRDYEVYSMGHKGKYGCILRTKEGEWLV